MQSIDLSAARSPAADLAPGPGDVAPPSTGAQRLSWLFRHSLRAGQVHPLLHVLRQRADVHGALLETRAAARPAVQVPKPAHIDIEELRRKLRELPSLPQVVLDVMTLLRDEEVSAAAVADRIERDQALAAQTLRIANSAFYGVPGRIGTIRNAINVIGLRTVSSLLTTAAVATRFSTTTCPEFEFGTYWRHAIATAIAARGLAVQLRMDENLAFTAGLLHDIGRLALAVQFPAEMGRALRYARDADVPALDAEREILGADHIGAGVLLATYWHFPASVVSAIEHHHMPTRTASAKPTLTDVVHVADAIAHGLDPSQGANETVPSTEVSAWDRLTLSVPQYLAVLDTTAAGVAGLCEALAL
ncbi:MAG: HDOD domain-containing protein [Burkholderiales bacterium]